MLALIVSSLQTPLLRFYLSKVSSRPNSRKGLVGKSLLSSLSTSDTVSQWKLDLGLGKLHAIGAFQVSSLDGSRPNDLNGTRTTAMTTSHFIIELSDGTRKCDIAKLAVHVVSSGSAGIAQPNAIVLDNARILLHNLYNVKNLARSLFHLVKLVQVVPKLGLDNGLVGGKENHPKGLWVGMLFGGGLAAHHLILAHNSSDSHLYVVNKRRENVREETELKLEHCPSCCIHRGTFPSEQKRRAQILMRRLFDGGCP